MTKKIYFNKYSRCTFCEKKSRCAEALFYRFVNISTTSRVIFFRTKAAASILPILLSSSISNLNIYSSQIK